MTISQLSNPSPRESRGTVADDDGLAAAIRRRVAVVAGCVLLGVIAGGIYLLLVPKRYVAVATLIVERMPFAPTAAEGVRRLDDETSLEAQADVIRSSEVLRLADKDGALGELKTLAHLVDPVPAVKRQLKVEVAPRRSVINVQYPSTDRHDAVKVVDLVIDAYRAYQSDERQRRSQDLSKVIAASRKKVEDQLGAARDALGQFEAAGGGAVTAEMTTARVASLSDALTKGQLDTFAAKRLYDESLVAAGPAMAGLDDKQLEAALQESAASAPETAEIIAQEIQARTSQLAELKKTFAENHPSVVRATQRLKQMRLAQVASARQRWAVTAAREESLKKAYDQVQKDAAALAVRVAERTRLQADVTRVQAQADELDRQLNQIVLASAVGTLNIRVDTPAEIDNPQFPPLPRATPTLATTGLIGLVIGGLFALVGEYREAGSLRHVVPLRSATLPSSNDVGDTLGLKVLAAIPDADIGASPREVAWAAQDDPFGPLANAVRAMRLAMEVDRRLPATMLLTAASDQQGTTTLAMNLAMTIARENRKVLLIDLNFRAPRAAATLDTDSSRGLAELIDNGDPIELIRPTAVPRLDVLPAGSLPTDSAKLLNSEAFTTLLTMLTSAYDHVIFDAPPLSRGDDARIVASMADGTVLVARRSLASLRRAAGARDLLLTIGANLQGVALNRGAPMDDERRQQTSSPAAQQRTSLFSTPSATTATTPATTRPE